MEPITPEEEKTVYKLPASFLKSVAIEIDDRYDLNNSPFTVESADKKSKMIKGRFL